MSLRGRLIFACLWIISLVIAASLASAQGVQRPFPPSQFQLQTAPIISGEDFGFRPEGWNGRARTGTFVVRINGEWVDAVAAVKTAPVTTR